MDGSGKQPFVVVADAAESCHRTGGYGRPGVDFKRIRKLERLRAEADVDGAIASDEVLKPQTRELVRPRSI